ncbi:MAG: TetR family transcriptional regulator [bacterium]
MSTGYLKSDERRAATIDSVVSLAAQRNPSEITTALIAQNMGVTQGALFRHFPSKDAIWESVMDWVAEHLLGRIEDVAVKADNPIEALRSVFLTHIDFVAVHPGIPRMLFGELQNQHDSGAKKVVRALLRRYSVVIELQIKRGQATGEIRPELDAKTVAGLFVGMVQGLVMQSMLVDQPESMLTNAPQTFDLFEHAIRHRSTP